MDEISEEEGRGERIFEYLQLKKHNATCNYPRVLVSPPDSARPLSWSQDGAILTDVRTRAPLLFTGGSGPMELVQQELTER